MIEGFLLEVLQDLLLKLSTDLADALSPLGPETKEMMERIEEIALFQREQP
jgi:hypothetical protein